MGKIDGRNKQGNTPMGVLARLAGEIAYTQQRLCLRGNGVVQAALGQAMCAVCEAMDYLEQVDAAEQSK